MSGISKLVWNDRMVNCVKGERFGRKHTWSVFRYWLGVFRGAETQPLKILSQDSCPGTNAGSRSLQSTKHYPLPVPNLQTSMGEDR
jgi:hypothetical protein